MKPIDLQTMLLMNQKLFEISKSCAKILARDLLNCLTRFKQSSLSKLIEVNRTLTLIGCLISI